MTEKSDLRDRLHLHAREVASLDAWRTSGDAPDEVLRALEKGQRGDADTLLRLLRAFRYEILGRQAALKARREAIDEAQREHEATAEWIDEQVRRLLEVHGVGATHKLVIDGEPLALRRATRVEIDGAFPIELVPPDLRRVRETTKVEPDKKAIKKALEDGRHLPSACLVQRRAVRW